MIDTCTMCTCTCSSLSLGYTVGYSITALSLPPSLSLSLSLSLTLTHSLSHTHTYAALHLPYPPLQSPIANLPSSSTLQPIVTYSSNSNLARQALVWETRTACTHSTAAFELSWMSVEVLEALAYITEGVPTWTKTLLLRWIRKVLRFRATWTCTKRGRGIERWRERDIVPEGAHSHVEGGQMLTETRYSICNKVFFDVRHSQCIFHLLPVCICMCL